MFIVHIIKLKNKFIGNTVKIQIHKLPSLSSRAVLIFPNIIFLHPKVHYFPYGEFVQ